MDWFLYDKGPRHERVKMKTKSCDSQTKPEDILQELRSSGSGFLDSSVRKLSSEKLSLAKHYLTIFKVEKRNVDSEEISLHYLMNRSNTQSFRKEFTTNQIQ